MFIGYGSMDICWNRYSRRKQSLLRVGWARTQDISGEMLVCICMFKLKALVDINFYKRLLHDIYLSVYFFPWFLSSLLQLLDCLRVCLLRCSSPSCSNSTCFKDQRLMSMSIELHLLIRFVLLLFFCLIYTHAQTYWFMDCITYNDQSHQRSVITVLMLCLEAYASSDSRSFNLNPLILILPCRLSLVKLVLQWFSLISAWHLYE